MMDVFEMVISGWFLLMGIFAMVEIVTGKEEPVPAKIEEGNE